MARLAGDPPVSSPRHRTRGDLGCAATARGQRHCERQAARWQPGQQDQRVVGVARGRAAGSGDCLAAASSGAALPARTGRSAGGGDGDQQPRAGRIPSACTGSRPRAAPRGRVLRAVECRTSRQRAEDLRREVTQQVSIWSPLGTSAVVRARSERPECVRQARTCSGRGAPPSRLRWRPPVRLSHSTISTGKHLLGLGVRAVGDHRCASGQPDRLACDGAVRPRCHELAGLGEILATAMTAQWPQFCSGRAGPPEARMPYVSAERRT